MAGELDFSKEHLGTEEAFARLLCLLVHGSESLTALTLHENASGLGRALGSIPPELTRCAQLKVLNLKECGLEGESRGCSTLRDGTESETSHTFPAPVMCRRDSRVDQEPDEPGETRARLRQ